MPQAATADPLTIAVSLVVLFFVLRYLFGPSLQRLPLLVLIRVQSPPHRSPPKARTDAANAPTPAPTSAPVDAVLAMFPDYPRATIERDLARTDSVEQTLDNILSGALPAPPPVSAPATASTRNSELPASFSPSPYLVSPSESDAPPPENVWNPNPTSREANLRARKEHMVRLARERALKKRTDDATDDNHAVAAASSKQKLG
ncbi:hypothetical protein HDU84_008083 [Entophlyctis sp. JEL0112]|nr:hypothetical protein HDU84_008083 [Entophlyctis sp. JEL0112]